MLKAITYIVGFVTVASTAVGIIQYPVILVYFGVVFGIMCLINPRL